MSHSVLEYLENQEAEFLFLSCMLLKQEQSLSRGATDTCESKNTLQQKGNACEELRREIFSLLNIKVPEAVSFEAPCVLKKSHPRRASCLESLTTYMFILNVCNPRRNVTGNEPKMSNCCPVSVCANWKLQ